jgi:hypothetical protein
MGDFPEPLPPPWRRELLLCRARRARLPVVEFLQLAANAGRQNSGNGRARAFRREGDMTTTEATQAEHEAQQRAQAIDEAAKCLRGGE